MVDDVEINREITALMAERLGLIPTTCEDGLVALNIVKEKDANYFDIILCDIQMPVMNGYTFTEEVRKLDDINKRHLPIIALTANAFEEDVKNALSHGMNGHIAKPISVESLESTIRKVLIERHQDE